MSKQATRYQRVIPNRADVRGAINARELTNEARRYGARGSVNR